MSYSVLVTKFCFLRKTNDEFNSKQLKMTKQTGKCWNRGGKGKEKIQKIEQLGQIKNEFKFKLFGGTKKSHLHKHFKAFEEFWNEK